MTGRARVLDVPNKLAVSWVYDLPSSHADSGFVRGFANGWQWEGSWQVYNGTPVTILNGSDNNGNADSAGDRPILNPSAKGRGVSFVDFVCNDGAGGATRIVPASAQDPNTGLVTGCGAGDDAEYRGLRCTRLKRKICFRRAWRTKHRTSQQFPVTRYERVGYGISEGHEDHRTGSPGLVCVCV